MKATRAVAIWFLKRTIFARSEWRDIEGHNTAVVLVSASKELLDSLKHDEVQGEAMAQRIADFAHSTALNLVRKRMEIGRYAPPK